jgi:hypothetical protein
MPFLVNGFNIENDLSTTKDHPTAIRDDSLSQDYYTSIATTYSPLDGAIGDSLTVKYNCYCLTSTPEYLRPSGTITSGLFANSIRYNTSSGANPGTMPANCNQILVYSVGGGGGGGSHGEPGLYGGGGNAGPGFNGEVAVGLVNIPAGSNFAVVVGTGGQGGDRNAGITATAGGPSYIRYPTAGTSPKSVEAQGGVGCPNGGDGSNSLPNPGNGSPATAGPGNGSLTAQQVVNPTNFNYTWPPTGQVTSPSGSGNTDSPTTAIGGFGRGATNSTPNDNGNGGRNGMVTIFFRNP